MGKETKSEELPVRYIVVRPARDGERCRKRRIIVFIRVSMIFHRFSKVLPAEGLRASLKNGFLFSMLLRLRDGCTLGEGPSHRCPSMLYLCATLDKSRIQIPFSNFSFSCKHFLSPMML